MKLKYIMNLLLTEDGIDIIRTRIDDINDSIKKKMALKKIETQYPTDNKTTLKKNKMYDEQIKNLQDKLKKNKEKLKDIS